jgi:hypothetical protein
MWEKSSAIERDQQIIKGKAVMSDPAWPKKLYYLETDYKAHYTSSINQQQWLKYDKRVK